MPDVPLDLRTRPQKRLDGLVGAAKVALAAGTLPAAGGLRPQVMVTIDYRDLLARLGHIDGQDLRAPPATNRRPGDTADGQNPATGPFRPEPPTEAHRQPRSSPDPSPPPPSARSPATPTSSPSSSAAKAGSWTSAAPPGLPAAHPQSPHRPRPGLRLPRLHHPRPLVRSPPHHLLVPRRTHRHRKRRAALLPPPPPDPQRTMDHPDPHRHPLVHPATPHRPTPKTQTQPLLPTRRPRHRSLTSGRTRRGSHPSCTIRCWWTLIRCVVGDG